MDEISFDQRTFGDGVPISTDGEMVPTVYLDEVSFFDKHTFGDGVPISTDGERHLFLINIHLGMGSRIAT